MTKYIVKETLTAKETNCNFAGQTNIYYSGKENRSWKDGEAKYGYGWYMTARYGYDRECDAKRNWNYKNCEDEEYWTKKVEIIKVTL